MGKIFGDLVQRKGSERGEKKKGTRLSEGGPFRV